MDQAAEKSDVGVMHRHRKVGAGLDQVIVHCVATAGDSEPAIDDQRGAKHKPALMERDVVICTAAQHIPNALVVGGPVRVVDQDHSDSLTPL